MSDPLADWLNDMVVQREDESEEQHLDRIKAALDTTLDEDI